MTDAVIPQSLPRIGILAADELRILGLRSILGDGETCAMVPLSPPSQMDASGLDLVIVDSAATDDVLQVLAAFRRLRPKLSVIVMGAATDNPHIERIIGAGAKGYLKYTADEAELRMAIAVVLDGSVWAPRKVLVRLLERSLRPAAVNSLIIFTPRETEVLRLLVLGHPNRQIAQLLGVDEGTIKAHMGRLMRKAGVENRTALSMNAIERQWIK